MSKTQWKLSRTSRVFSLEPTGSAGQRWESWVRRFENYIVAKNIQNDKRMKAMFAETKRKLTEYFRPQCNEEYVIFKFRQADQMAAETLDQYNTR